MVIENLTNGILLEDLIGQVSSLTTLFQAIGGLIILYIIFNIINMIINRKKKKQLEEISENLKEIKKILKRKK